MEQEKSEFTLKELCKAADVTERTVRFYIAEGLLEPPAGPKSRSRYGYEHLLCLHLIRQLKERYLPLRQIKELVAAKNVTELLKLARELELSSQPSSKGEQGPMTTTQIRPTELIQTINRLNFQSPGQSFSPVNSLNPVQSRSDNRVVFPGWQNQSRPVVQPPIIIDNDADKPVLWQRIEIAPGIELHLDSDIANAHRDTLKALTKEIRRALDK